MAVHNHDVEKASPPLDNEKQSPHNTAAHHQRDLTSTDEMDRDAPSGRTTPRHTATPPPEPAKDPYEVGWDDGDNDPWCPRSRSQFRKWLITLILANGSLCVTGASSMYTSTYEQMEAVFHESREVSNVGLSLFVLGIALGPMFLGPLSEFYGRRPIYLVAWSFYVIWIIPQAVAQNIETMLICRFLDGFSGSAFLAVSAGTVGDLFSKEDLQFPMAIFSIAPNLGPSIGPLVGGFINSYADWRWTYYVLLMWSFVLLIAIVFFVPETFHPVILRNKARQLRKDTGDDRFMAPTEKTEKSIAHAIGRSLLRPFQLLIFEPMCLNLCIFSALLLGIIYLFFVAFPLVFTNNHGFTLWQVGLSFLGIFVGMIAAISTDAFWARLRVRLVRKLELETGVPGKTEPEIRLPPTILGSFLAPAGLFMFAWSTFSYVHWIVPIIGSAIFGAGVVLCFTGIYTFLVDAYPAYAASALAANTLLRCTFAAAFPLFGEQMYNKLGYQWASTLLAFLALAMLPFPWIFFKYGKRIRSNSRFATS